MTTDEYIEYLSEDTATEGLVDYLKSPDFKSSLTRSAGSMFLDILDSIAANLIVLGNNLTGYVIHKTSAELLEAVIDRYDKMIDESTFNFDRLIQGFSQSDISVGVSIFETKSLTSQTTARIAIDESLSELKKYKKHMATYESELESSGISKEMILDFTSSTKLQQKMLKLQRKIMGLSKKIRLSLSKIHILEKYGIDKDYAEFLLSTNRNELAKMGTIVIAAFSDIYMRPENIPNVEHSGLKRAKEMIQAVS